MLVTIQETADRMNKIESESRYSQIIVLEAGRASQETNSKRTLEVGSSLRIPRQITTLPAGTASRELLHGSPKVRGLRNGHRRVLCSGFMENVRFSIISFSLRALIAVYPMVSQLDRARVFCGKSFPRNPAQPIQIIN
jgi:hypothetical protein